MDRWMLLCEGRVWKPMLGASFLPACNSCRRFSLAAGADSLCSPAGAIRLVQETQTKPEGQIHFFPILLDGKQLYDVMVER